VKCLEEKLMSEEMFPVVSGDALCDFDLTRAMEFHKKKNAHVTVILSSVRTPLEYGVVLQDTLKKIFAFSEKPDWSETLSDQVNTGVYILSPSVLKEIPENEPFDFSQDLFPLLLKKGFSLYGFKDEGYWCDIGRIPTLYRCNQDLLEGKARTYFPRQGETLPAADGKGCYFLSHGATVEKGARVESGSVISPGVKLKKGCRVAASLVMEDTTLEEGSSALSSILCEKNCVEEGAVLTPGTVLGANSRLEKKAVTESGKRYPPQSVLFAQDPFHEKGLFLTERGSATGEHPGLDRDETERLGTAFARLYQKPVGILWDKEKKDSRYFALLFAGGVILSGQNAILFGEGEASVASFAAHRTGAPCVFVSEMEGKGVFFHYTSQGFPLLRKEVLSLSRLWEDKKLGENSGRILFQENMEEEYENALSRIIGEGNGKDVGFFGAHSVYLKKAAIKSGFSAYDLIREKGISLAVFPESLKLYLNGECIANTENARLFVISEEMRSGRKEFFLPRHAPRAFSERIYAGGGSLSYFSLQHTVLSEEARRQGAYDRYLYDLNFLGASLLRYLSPLEDSVILRRFREQPEIYITRLNYYPEETKKARILTLSSQQEKEGIRVEPGFYGIRIISEALSAEAALDHAFEYRGKLNEIEKSI